MASSANKAEDLKSKFGQIVLVFQGGGALGAYQAGVYEALHEAGIEPDWLIGTSIGAINATIIAGNKPEDRLDKLREFWRRVEHSPVLEAISRLPWIGASLPNWNTLAAGISGFFRPNPLAFMGWQVPLAPDAAGYYSTAPLAGDAQRTRRFLADRQVHAAPHGRRRQGAHERDALFRQPRHADQRPPRDGFGRAASGLSGRAHRRRPLLGRRDPVEHAGRGGLRRQSAPQLAHLRGPYLESGWRRA